MRRKLAALLLCLLLVFQMSAVSSEAAGTVYFTAVNKNVLSLSDATMPFWSGGYLYVPSTIFTGVGRDLGVSYYPNIAKQTVLLYVDDTIYSSLVFDLNKDYAIDNEGNMYFQKPIQRGGVIFLPISLIARCFGLLYSTVEVDRGYLVWVRNPDMDMEERYFADAARSRMDYEYSQYLRNQGADAADDRPVTEQLEAGNRLLSQAASVKTRLAWIRNATAEAVAEAEAAGFCCLTPDLDRSAYPLSSTGAADTLFQRVTSRSGAVTVWLGDGANAAGLGSFLSAAEAADDRCLAMTETVS